MHLCWYSSGTHAVTVTVGRKNKAAGKKGRKKCGKQRKEEMTSFLRKGAVTANCNRL